MTPRNNIGFDSKGSEDMETEITKITSSNQPTVICGPLATEPPRMSA